MKSRIATALLLAVTVLLSCVSLTYAQTNTASVRGKVTDPQNRPVSGATVTVSNTDLSSKRTTTTDSTGSFIISNLVPGAVTVEATGSGLVTRRPVRVTISLGSTTQVTLKLSTATVSQSTTVTGRRPTSEGNTTAPPVNTDDAAAKIFFPGMEVTYLPNRDRDFSQYGQLAPGVKEEAYSNGVIVAGQRSSAVITQVDGVNFNDPLLGGRRGANDGTFFLPQTVVREFQIVRAGVSVETGGTNAGFINVVTKEGSSKYHGEAFFTGRPPALTSADAFGNSPDNVQNTFGGSIGGPIHGTHAFFYTGIEQDFLHAPYWSQFQDQAPGIVVPEALKGLQGQIIEKNTPTAFLGRVDEMVDPENTLNLQLALNRIRSSDVGDGSTRSISTVDNASSLSGQSIWSKAAWTRVLGSRSVNEALASWSQDHRNLTPNSVAPEIAINGFGILGGNSLGQHLYSSEQFQLSDNVSISRGGMLLTLGGTFAYDPAYEQREANLNGRFDYNSLTDYLAFHPRRFQQTFVTGKTRYSGVVRELGLFANAKITVRPRLTMTGGLRWVGQWNPQPPNPNPAVVQTQSIPNDLAQWQPRLGLAWTPTAKTVLRASSGLFSAPTPATVFHRVFADNGLQTVVADTYFDPQVLALTGALTGTPHALSGPPAGLTKPDAFIAGIDSNFRNPTSFQVAADIERDITAKLNLAAGYVHNSTWHLQREIDQNLSPPTNNSSGIPVFPSTRPNPAIGRLLVNWSSAHSSYDGLLITGTSQISRRTQITANYTLSKTQDDDSNPGPYSIASALNPYDLKAEHADSLQDVRNNFNLSAVINLPVGFKFNPILVARSGQPYTPVIGFDTQNDANDWNDRAIIDGKEAARNSMRQSSFANLDLRIVKDFTLKGVGHHLDLFMDVFNVTGTGNRNFGPESISLFGLPNSQVFTAGQALFAPNVAHLGGPREIQFTARLVAF
jgi:Carboxypeptidase regulatory-like domain